LEGVPAEVSEEEVQVGAGSLCIAGLLLCFAGISDEASEVREKKIRILFAGDIMGHDSQIQAALIDSTGGYDYRDCFRYLEPYLGKADIAVGNLEVTLAGPPYRGYPRFSSPDTLADALLDAGFHVLLKANNHALDRGKEGLERTEMILDEKGLIQTGAFVSGEIRQLTYPLILEKNGIMLALLNYTYGSNSLVADTPNIVNYIDTLQLIGDLHKVKQAQPDFIIACVHWGREYERVENPGQRELADFMFSNGVDVIIGSHPHVVQPVNYVLADSSYLRPVVYSLGNFISNQRDRYRDGGILIGMEFSISERKRISGLDYLPFWVHKPLEGDRHVFRLIPGFLPEEKISTLGFTDEELEKYRQFCEDTRDHLSNVLIMEMDP
jgi:poly-gamma-glutamate synthesis protein (capsule biosynthesis protein)